MNIFTSAMLVSLIICVGGCAEANKSKPMPTKLCDHSSMTKARSNSAAVGIDFGAMSEILQGFPTIREAGENIEKMANVTADTETQPC